MAYWIVAAGLAAYFAAEYLLGGSGGWGFETKGGNRYWTGASAGAIRAALKDAALAPIAGEGDVLPAYLVAYNHGSGPAGALETVRGWQAAGKLAASSTNLCDPASTFNAMVYCISPGQEGLCAAGIHDGTKTVGVAILPPL